MVPFSNLSSYSDIDSLTDRVKHRDNDWFGEKDATISSRRFILFFFVLLLLKSTVPDHSKVQGFGLLKHSPPAGAPPAAPLNEAQSKWGSLSVQPLDELQCGRTVSSAIQLGAIDPDDARALVLNDTSARAAAPLDKMQREWAVSSTVQSADRTEYDTGDWISFADAEFRCDFLTYIHGTMSIELLKSVYGIDPLFCLCAAEAQAYKVTLFGLFAAVLKFVQNAFTSDGVDLPSAGAFLTWMAGCAILFTVTMWSLKRKSCCSVNAVIRPHLSFPLKVCWQVSRADQIFRRK